MRKVRAQNAKWCVLMAEKGCKPISSAFLIVRREQTRGKAANLPPNWFREASGCWLMKWGRERWLRATVHTAYPQSRAAFSDWTNHPIVALWVRDFRSKRFLLTPPGDHHHSPHAMLHYVQISPHVSSIELTLMAASLLFGWLCVASHLACPMTHVNLVAAAAATTGDVIAAAVAAVKQITAGSVWWIAAVDMLRHMAAVMWYK